MKPLRLNPLSHEIILRELDLPSDVIDDVGLMHVAFQLGSHHGDNIFTAEHLEAVGKWFLRAATACRRKVKKAGG